VGVTPNQKAAGGPLPGNHTMALEEAKCAASHPLFAPTSEEVVGITEYYRANVGGMNYDISRRYSSSGGYTFADHLFF